MWGQKVLPHSQLKSASLFGFSSVLALFSPLQPSSSRTNRASGHWFLYTCPMRCRSSESQAASRSFSEGGFWGPQLMHPLRVLNVLFPGSGGPLPAPPPGLGPNAAASREPSCSLPFPPLCGPGTGLWPQHPTGELVPVPKWEVWGEAIPIPSSQARPRGAPRCRLSS